MIKWQKCLITGRAKDPYDDGLPTPQRKFEKETEKGTHF